MSKMEEAMIDQIKTIVSNHLQIEFQDRDATLAILEQLPLVVQLRAEINELKNENARLMCALNTDENIELEITELEHKGSSNVGNIESFSLDEERKKIADAMATLGIVNSNQFEDENAEDDDDEEDEEDEEDEDDESEDDDLVGENIVGEAVPNEDIPDEKKVNYNIGMLKEFSADAVKNFTIICFKEKQYFTTDCKNGDLFTKIEGNKYRKDGFMKEGEPFFS